MVMGPRPVDEMDRGALPTPATIVVRVATAMTRSVATEEHQQRTQTGHDDAADDGDQREHVEHVRRQPRRPRHRRRCGGLSRRIGQRRQVGEQPVEIGLRPPAIAALNRSSSSSSLSRPAAKCADNWSQASERSRSPTRSPAG